MPTYKGHALIDDSNKIADGAGQTISTFLSSQLADITGINTKNTGLTTLLVVPSGKHVILSNMIVLYTLSTDIATPASASIGANSTIYDDWLEDITLPDIPANTRCVSMSLADEASSSTNNLFDNGGFDTWTGNSPDYWTIAQIGTGTIASEAVIIYEGIYSAAITAVANGDGFRLSQSESGLREWREYQVYYYGRKGDQSSANAKAGIICLNGTWAAATQIFNYTTEVWDNWTGTASADQKYENALTTSFAKYTPTNKPTAPANGIMEVFIYATGDAGDVMYLDACNYNRIAPLTGIVIYDDTATIKLNIYSAAVGTAQTMEVRLFGYIY